MKPAHEDNRKALLLGLGLDNDDGHVRLTKGDNFRLVGGSRPTHEKMQEIAVRINEELDGRGKTLEQVSGVEFRDIVEKVTDKVDG